MPRSPARDHPQAHYDLVTTRLGRARLRSFGLNPYLVRVSVGADEDPRDILAALEEAIF